MPNFLPGKTRLLAMKSLILTTRDIQKIVKELGVDSIMDQLISQLGKAIEGFDPNIYQVPVRDGFSYKKPSLGLIEWMPSLKAFGNATIKMVGYHPANPREWGLPTIISTIYSFDIRTGHLIGLVDGTLLTAMRTGAVSAIASQALAFPYSKVLGLVGCGAQAVTQLHALSRVFTFEDVLIYDTEDDAQSSFLSRVSKLGLKGINIEKSSLPLLVESCDIICTATSVGIKAGPVFQDTETKPWLHINAVGSDFPGKTEIPITFLKRSLVCPEFPEQALKEGECQQLSAGEVGPTLTEVLRNPLNYQEFRKNLTVFDSTGWAVEDQVACELFFDYAKELKIGTPIEIEYTPEDPKDPYQFFTPLSPGASANNPVFANCLESSWIL